MQFDLFDLEEGRRLRDKGAEQAADHAESVSDGWRKSASKLLDLFCMGRDEFMTEDLRYFAHSLNGLELPPDSRAWGAIILKAVRDGKLVRDRYEPMKSKNCHANPKSVWKVVKSEVYINERS